MHTRRIEILGFLRDDGLIDLEAHLADTKPRPGTNEDGSVRAAGEPVHDMFMRMTITRDREIVACEAAMEATPYAICPRVAVNFERLVGLKIEGGFLRKAQALVGHDQGCTHLRELLQQIGTTAFQTLYSVGVMNDDPESMVGQRPPLLNTCYAWGEGSEMIREKFPEWARAKAEA